MKSKNLKSKVSKVNKLSKVKMTESPEVTKFMRSIKTSIVKDTPKDLQKSVKQVLNSFIIGRIRYNYDGEFDELSLVFKDRNVSLNIGHSKHESRETLTYEIKEYGLSDEDDDDDPNELLEVKGQDKIEHYLNSSNNENVVYDNLSQKQKDMFETYMNSVNCCGKLDYKYSFALFTRLFIKVIEKCKKTKYSGFW